MGMADPRPDIPHVTEITLPLERLDPPDENITCEVCHSHTPVEWAIVWKCNGRVIFTGLHEACRKALGGCR